MSWSYSPSDLTTTTASGRLFKNCGTCKESKPLSEYTKNKSSRDGFYSLCKDCKRNRDSLYRGNNKKHIKLSRKKYYESNKASYFSRNSLKRVSLRKAKPSWLSSEQQKQIFSIYDLARECKNLTGDDYHVDHIIPLNGQSVCGLHVPWNLQVLPAEINLSKKNKFDGGW